MQPELHIDLFGDFRILSGDELLAVIPQARQQALLVYLLLHRSAPQPRSHIAFLLWPDSSEGQALSNLRKMLTHLRQTAPVLVQALYADHKVIQWRPTVPFTLDVADFEAQLAQANAAEQAGRQRETLACLAAAVELYAGPLVPSCYDDWIIAERERCQQSCLNALERLIILYESQGDLATATRYAQQLLRLDPLQETIYLQLMRLQALQGDRAGALRTYHTCATILERELDVAPGEEIQDAYARLLKLETGATVTRRVTVWTRLVGRQAEWEKLQRIWQLVIGQSFTFALLAQASGGDEDALARALDELWQRRIIREQDGAAYDFSHDRIRDVAYAEISPAQRWLFHRRVAQALETIHIDDLDRVCVQVAWEIWNTFAPSTQTN